MQLRVKPSAWPDSGRQESLAVPLRVCAVDPRDDPAAVAGTVSTEAERGQCGTVAQTIGADVSASVVQGDGAGPPTSAAVAAAGLSSNSRGGAAVRGGNLLWR